MRRLPAAQVGYSGFDFWLRSPELPGTPRSSSPRSALSGVVGGRISGGTTPLGGVNRGGGGAAERSPCEIQPGSVPVTAAIASITSLPGVCVPASQRETAAAEKG